MNFDQTLSQFLAAASHDAGLQAALIIVGTFILEDATTIFAAIRSADGELSLLLALGALYCGIILGDFGLYGLGRLAAYHDIIARRLGLPRHLQRAQTWLDGRLVPAVVSARFLPGMRLPTYLVCGFLGVSFRRFAFSVIGGVLIWTSLLFSVTYSFGNYVSAEAHRWRWPLGIGLAFCVVVTERLIALYRRRRVQTS